jgi:hypothetical protein
VVHEISGLRRSNASGGQPCDSEDSTSPRLADANINPASGLATDYLNHFNEAIMLLEILSSCPDFRHDSSAGGE